MRYLEDSKTFKTKYQFIDHTESRDSKLKYVNYEYFSQTNNEDIANYEWNSIDESEYKRKKILNALKILFWM